MFDMYVIVMVTGPGQGHQAISINMIWRSKKKHWTIVKEKMMMEKKTRTIQHITCFLWFVVVLFAWACIASPSLAASSVANPGCLETCGDVIVPYPFGIEDPKCAKDKYTFLLDCNRSTNPPKLYIGKNNKLFDISQTMVKY